MESTYCFVVFGDEENCLDPEAGFRVYSPDIAANTGDTVNLRLFMNRQDTNAEYTWSVRSRPGRSSASIDNPIGTVDESSLFDHIYEVQPTFVPDIPGEYILVIEVVGKFTEELTVAYATVQHEVRISVSGVPISTAGSGCSTLATQGPVSILWLIFMFFYKCILYGIT